MVGPTFSRQSLFLLFLSETNNVVVIGLRMAPTKGLRPVVVGFQARVARNFSMRVTRYAGVSSIG